MDKETCHDHSGCLRDIANLNNDNKDQWEEIHRLACKMDKIFARINVMLGGIACSCILLVVNILTR